MGGDLTASDFGEGIKGLAEIFTEEVSAKLYLQTVDDALDAVVRTGQRIVMTGIGDDDIVVGEGRNVSCFVDGSFQIVNTRSKLGADGDKWVI